MAFRFYNTFRSSFSISSLFSGGIIVSSTFLQISLITGFSFTILLTILFPINSPVALASLWITFLEVTFRPSSHVLGIVPDNFSHLCWIDLLQMIKIHILQCIFLFLVL